MKKEKYKYKGNQIELGFLDKGSLEDEIVFSPKKDIDDYKKIEISEYNDVKNKNSILKSKWFWIISIAIVVLVFPYLSRQIKDSKPLEANELLGEWSSSSFIDFYFASDGTFTTNEQYISGKWEVENSEKKLIRIWYTISGEQVNAYNNEHKYDFDENEAIYLSPEEIMEIILHEGDESFPQEGEYVYIRSKTKLQCIEDDYYCLYR